MQKILFGIFAHPDDEAFGPAATLLKETRDGAELHLITLTAGENGTNPDNVPDLAHVRLDEWRKAGKLLGATAMHYLEYKDGQLGNHDHIAIAGEIDGIVKATIENRHDFEIEFISLDTNGFTGHIDHIVAARSALLAFHRLKKEGLPVKRVRLACFSRDDIRGHDTSFVLMEPGRTTDEIDEVIDGRDILDDVKEVMYVHHSQRHDCENALNALGDRIAINHFIVED